MVQRIDVGTRMSEAAIHNGTVYLAGQIAEVPGQDIEGQTRQVLAAIDALLTKPSRAIEHPTLDPFTNTDRKHTFIVICRVEVVICHINVAIVILTITKLRCNAILG